MKNFQLRRRNPCSAFGILLFRPFRCKDFPEKSRKILKNVRSTKLVPVVCVYGYHFWKHDKCNAKKSRYHYNIVSCRKRALRLRKTTMRREKKVRAIKNNIRQWLKKKKKHKYVRKKDACVNDDLRPSRFRVGFVSCTWTSHKPTAVVAIVLSCLIYVGFLLPIIDYHRKSGASYYNQMEILGLTNRNRLHKSLTHLLSVKSAPSFLK